MNKFQNIIIEHVDNGVKIKAGCLNLVYQQKDLKQFFKDLESYFTDPEKAEKTIRKRWKLAEPELGPTTSAGNTIYWNASEDIPVK